jgi:hypothetical protein
VRLERAGRDDYLAPRVDLPDLLALVVFDADRALALEQDAGGVGEGFDAEIGTLADVRMHVGARGAPAFAALLRHLVDAEAFVILGVKVLADPELGLLRGLKKGLLDRIARAQFVDGERAPLP